MKFTIQSINALLLISSTTVSVSSFTTTSTQYRHQRPRPSFLLSQSVESSKTATGTTKNESTITESTDKAPCYDSICSSDPNTPLPPNDNNNRNLSSPPPPIGQAIQRLGLSTGPTVWSEFGRLASNDPTIANLGQGFPDWLPPQFAIDSMVEAAQDVIHNSPHQYTRTAGHPRLVKELAGRYSKHLKREVDPMGEVGVTVGASQALYLALQTLIQPGEFVCLK